MYTLIWRFTVKPARRADFERHYSASGTWAALFRESPDYLGTELLRDTARDNIYVTIDRWTDAAAFAAFKAAHGVVYAALDRECESLTTHEECLAVCEEPSSPSGSGRHS
jgi:quinol monooxygenase YgiN